MKSNETETLEPQKADIIDRGRGPEITGTRITIYDVLDYVLECWPPARIAAWFNIQSPQVETALEYIREHTIEVLTNYVKILERCARGNPPELQAKLNANHAKFQELVKQVREAKNRSEKEIQDLIKKYREPQTKANGDDADHGRQ